MEIQRKLRCKIYNFGCLKTLKDAKKMKKVKIWSIPSVVNRLACVFFGTVSSFGSSQHAQ